MFHREHSQCFADSNDQCKYGRILVFAFGVYSCFPSCYFFLHVQGQVLCDRHYGGINYPVGGVGGIAKSLAEGLVDQGSEILYKANVKSIILDDGKAVSFCMSLVKVLFFSLTLRIPFWL